MTKSRKTKKKVEASKSGCQHQQTVETKKPEVVAAINLPIPSLDETCSQLEDAFQGVMSGSIELDRARVALGYKKQQMKRFDYGVQMARMNPALRPAIAKFLGLPVPEDLQKKLEAGK